MGRTAAVPRPDAWTSVQERGERRPRARRHDDEKEEGRAAARGRTRFSVLCVGTDREDVARLARATFPAAPAEFSVEGVQGLDAARERLGRGQVDVVVTRTLLPESAGDEAVARLVRLAAPTPVVVLLEHEDEAAALTALAAGAADVLTRGNPDEVLVAARRAAVRAAAQTRLRPAAHEVLGQDLLAGLAPVERSVAFAEQRARLVALMDASFEGVSIHEDGRILEVNEAFAAMFGHPPEALVGSEIFLCAAPEVRDDVRARVRDGDPGPYETVGIRSDGTRFDLEVRGRTRRIGGRRLRVAVVRDITREKTLRRRLEESEERHRSLFQEHPDAVFALDLEGRIVDLNPAAGRMAALVGPDAARRPMRSLVDEDDREAWDPLWETAVAGQAATGLVTLRTQDGRTPIVSMTTVPIRVEGRTVGVFGVARDVSDALEAGRRLEESEKRYRLIATHATDLISRHDLRLGFLYASPAAYRLLGHEPSALVGRSLVELVHPDDRSVVDRMRRSVLSGAGETTVRYRVRARDGREVCLESSCRTVLDSCGRPVEVIAVSRDVSDQVRQAQVMERIAEQNRMILESAGQGIVGLNLKGNVTFMNATAARFIGHATGATIGRSFHALVHPVGSCGCDGPCPFGAALDAAGDADVRSMETVFRRRDASRFPVRASVAPVRTSDAVVGAVLVFDDISERKRAEALLQARTEELEAFAYAVSHDLRTPIVSLDWLTEELREQVPTASTDIHGLIGRVRTNVDRMDRLVRDLIDLARLGGENALEEWVDLGETVRAVVDAQRERAEERAVSMTIEDPGRMPVVAGPEPRIRQVLENLLGNAVKYVEDGGHVVVRAVRREEGLAVEVEDDGPGVPVDYRERVFQLFERAPDPLGRRIFGSGIGLALARRVARKLGGDLTVTEGGSGGALFCFMLPPGRIVKGDMSDPSA
ncbi:MAG: PAS domain S-box protein [Euryarchaeota archaeon]|nr:PAS domain S-box protein [Euryarchaeota archaeon]